MNPDRKTNESTKDFYWVIDICADASHRFRQVQFRMP
jgi:hypothetical protein